MDRKVVRGLTKEFLKGFDYKFRLLDIPASSFCISVNFSSFEKFRSFLKKFYVFCRAIEDVFSLTHIFIRFKKGKPKTFCFSFEKERKFLVLRNFLLKYLIKLLLLFPCEKIKWMKISYFYVYCFVEFFPGVGCWFWNLKGKLDPVFFLLPFMMAFLALEKGDGDIDIYYNEKIKELKKSLKNKDIKEIYIMLQLLYDEIKSYR